jgi:hypothetical protein
MLFMPMDVYRRILKPPTYRVINRKFTAYPINRQLDVTRKKMGYMGLLLMVIQVRGQFSNSRSRR